MCPRAVGRSLTHRYPTGYFVTAPDLLGHGNARRGSDYTIAALTEELRPLFTIPGHDDPPYDVVVGHSLGGLVASALLPLLKCTRPVRVVLVDPPLEQTPEQVAFHRTLFGNTVRNPKTPEEIQHERPQCTKENAILFSLSVRLCDVAAVEAILDVSLCSNPGWRDGHSCETRVLAKRAVVVFTPALVSAGQRSVDRAGCRPVQGALREGGGFEGIPTCERKDGLECFSYDPVRVSVGRRRDSPRRYRGSRLVLS